MTWTIYPIAQLRTSGFDIDEVLPRPTGASALAERELVAAEAAVADRAAQFSRDVYPLLRAKFPEFSGAQRNHAVRAARLVKGGRRVEGAVLDFLHAQGLDGWVTSWSTLLDTADSAAARLETACAEESGAIFAQVRDTLREPRVAQAIAQSAPGFAACLDPDAQDARPRGKQRTRLLTAHRFLRRLGVRCETVSFYGPSLFVRMDPEQSEPVVASKGSERVSVDASAWLVREVTRRVRPGRTVSRDPLWREENGALVRVLDGRTLPLDDDARRAWQTLGEPGGPVPKTLAPALRVGPQVPATERHALAWFADRVPDDLVTAVRDGLAAAECSGWPERTAHFGAVAELLRGAQLPTSRAAGQHYADRSFWHEECSSPYSERTTLGAPALAAADRVLQAVLPLLYRIAVLERADARAALRNALGGRTVNLAAAAMLTVDESTPRADALRHAVGELVRAAAGGSRVVQLDPSTLSEACRNATVLQPDRDPAWALPGLDLLAAGSELGRAKWVVGEVHDDASSIFGGSSSRVHSDPDRLYVDFCDAVAGLVPVEWMATIVSRRRSMHITPELPGLSIELAGVSAKPAGQVAPICEAEVRADGSAVWVGERRYWLYPGDLRSVLHRAVALPCLRTFALPASYGAARPRVEVDGVVLTRASWSVGLPERAGWRWTQALRRELGLTDRVFVRPEQEPKPVFVDLDDPVAVDDLGRFGPCRAVVTECLPDLDELWWRPNGAQVAELRLGCLIAGDPIAEGTP
jgi:hypothetical protein